MLEINTNSSIFSTSFMMRTHTHILSTAMSAMVLLSILACAQVDDDNAGNNENMNTTMPDAGSQGGGSQDAGPVDGRTMKTLSVTPTSIALKRRELADLEGALDGTLCFSSASSRTAGFTLEDEGCDSRLLDFLSVEPNVDDIYIAVGQGYTLDSHSSGTVVQDNPLGRSALKINSFTKTTLVLSDDTAPDTTFTLSVEFRVSNKVTAYVDSVTYATP